MCPPDDDKPTNTTTWPKTPSGLGRGDHTFGMPAPYTPPEVAERLARPRPPDVKGLKWWQQPGHLRQRDDD